MSAPAMTLPTWLTLLRLALIPPTVGLVLLDGADWMWVTALALFFVAAITDWIDGWLARKLDQISLLGTVLDPIADKVLTAALLVALVAQGSLGGMQSWAAILILAREFLVAGLREALAPRGFVMPVTQLAKWKTTIQFVALAALLLAGFWESALLPALALLWLATALTWITGFRYLADALAFMRRPRQETEA